MKFQVILTFLLLLSLSGCKSSKVVSDKTTTTSKEETFTSDQEVKIKIPERKENFRDKLPVLQPVRFIAMVKGETKILHEHSFITFNKDSTAFLKGRIDSLGNIVIQSTYKEYEYKAIIEVQNKRITEHTDRIVKLEREQNWFGKFFNKLAITGSLILFLLILLAIFYRKLRNFFLPKIANLRL